jgi:hypothetical protein
MSMLLDLCTLAFFYCLGISWLLQVAIYPTYRLVGAADFVPFHVAQGKRMIPVMVVPMFASALLGIVTAILSRTESHALLLWGVGLCGLIIIATTLISEVPKHMKLDKDGKDDALIEGLIRDNLPRSLAWTVGAALLVAAHVQAG